MTIRQAINTAFSHNAKVTIQEDQHDGFSKTVWKGQLHSLPEEYLDREFQPISDYMFYEKQYEAPIMITLK